jgi:hypothetical protein
MVRTGMGPKQGRYLLALLALVGLLLLAQGSEASAQDCQVEDRHGELRDCTFLEDVLDCMYDALDSWVQCMDDADGWFDRIVCEASQLINNNACVISTAMEWSLGSIF